MAFINRSELNVLFPETIYIKIGSYISSPTDIVHMRQVSFLFREFVSKGACQSFLLSHASLIESTGFFPSSDDIYENFKELILFFKYRVSKNILQERAISARQSSYVTSEKIFSVVKGELASLISDQRIVNLWSRQAFRKCLFSTFDRSNIVFSIMNTA